MKNEQSALEAVREFLRGEAHYDIRLLLKQVEEELSAQSYLLARSVQTIAKMEATPAASRALGETVMSEKEREARLRVAARASRAQCERRERIASEQLAALIAAGWETHDHPETKAVYYADALIAELDRKEGA